MSKIKLNSITINKSIPDDPFFYIGALVKSNSGYLLPHLLTSIEDLMTIYGEFKYDSMYKDLIRNGIAVCILPVLTKESEYNVCSLRLSNGDLTVSHPKKSKKYTYKKLDNRVNKFKDLISEGEYFYGLILDFSNVTLDTLTHGTVEDSDVLDANYIIINTGRVIDEGINDTMDQIVSTGKNLSVSSSDYNRPEDLLDPYIIFNKTIDFEDLNVEPTKYNYLKNFKDIWNDPIHTKYTDSECKDISDLIFSYITKFLNAHGLPQSESYPKGLPLDQWKQAFIDESYIEDFWLLNNEEVADVLKTIIDPLTLDKVTSNILINRLNNLKLSNDKLMLVFNNPAYDLNHYDFKGLEYSPSYNYTQDVLCNYTNNDKVVEFYSKIKGEVGKDITISIDSVRFIDDVYNITISNKLITESYTVKLFDTDYSNSDVIHITDISKLSKLVDVRFYNYWYGARIDNELTNHYLIDDRYFDIYNDSDLDYYPENKRNQSELKLPLGTFRLNRVTEEDYRYRDILDSLEIYKSSDWYPDLFIVPELENDVTRYADGTVRDNMLNEILKLVDYDYTTNTQAVNHIDSDFADKSIFSQAFINLSADQLNTEWYTLSKNKKYDKLVSKDNRLLYFFGKIFINGVEYPSFYPYILSFINQEYLEYDTTGVLYDPFSIKVGGNLLLYRSGSTKLIDAVEILECTKIDYGKLLKVTSQHLGEERLTYYGLLNETDMTFIKVDPTTLVPIDRDEMFRVEPIMSYIDDRRINILHYDNLNYFWEDIYEPIDQSSEYLIRFISSKYVRECYKIRHQLTGLTHDQVVLLLEELNSKCLNNLVYVDTSEFEVLYNTNDPNLMKITFSITIPKLSNREYKLDIILNV